MKECERCDSVPINCIWWTLERYFKMLEEKKKAESEKKEEKENDTKTAI